MKEKINELIKDSIEKFNVYVDDAFVDTEEGKKRLNIVLDSAEIIDLNRIKEDIKAKVIFKNKNNKLLGIYELDNNKLKVWKNFN